MDDSTWDEIIGTMTAGDPSAADDAATDAAAPEDDPALTEDPTTDDSPVDDSFTDDAPADDGGDPEPVQATAPEPQPAPTPAPDWRQDPEAAAALEKAQRFDQLAAAMEQARALQAQEAFRRQLDELSDGDAERHQQLTGLLAQATAPLAQQVQAATVRAESTAQTTSALWLAIEDVLDDATRAKVLETHGKIMERLPQVGPFALQDMIRERKTGQSELNRALAAKDAEIAALRKQVAARQQLSDRQLAGADRVDGGGGTALPTDQRARMEQAGSMDEYMAALFGR